MATVTFPNASIIRWLVRWPALPEAARNTPSCWASGRLLSRFDSPGDAVLAVRGAADSSEVFAELIARDDETSTLAALAGIAPRLAAVLWHWWTCGTPDTEIEDLESQLVTECISLMRSQPELPPAVLVRSARYRVFGRRRTERARNERHSQLRPDTTSAVVKADATEPSVLLPLRRREATALWLWACGWKTHEAAELLGSTPQAVRASRSRGIRALRATREAVA